jgi:hypothetical protein
VKIGSVKTSASGQITPNHVTLVGFKLFKKRPNDHFSIIVPYFEKICWIFIVKIPLSLQKLGWRIHETYLKLIFIILGL